MEEWNFENWGVKYWSKTPEFLQYVKKNIHDTRKLKEKFMQKEYKLYLPDKNCYRKAKRMAG